ncbi:uncharacterized protein LOC143277753 [Babylonia areolata]|uniref:uncharacterized protein LOC143277753 n=1 Tax=Babylonia areolata TaxID=304850 RepID=UPI003FD1882E
MSTSTNAAACVEFSQHAWRPELCVNCQRPRSEHTTSVSKPAKASARIIINQSAPQEPVITSDPSQPVPNKRLSTLPRQSKTWAGSWQGEEKCDNRQDRGGSAPDNKGVGGGKEGERNHVNSQHASDAQKRRHRSVSKEGEGGTSRGSMKNGQPRGILSHKGSSLKEGKRISDDRRGSRVAFVDTAPQVIGYDGGVGSIFADDDDDGDNDDFSSANEASFSLTDEEKSFALLSLENTLWNSKAENLLKDRDTSASTQRHSSREFEDLSLDALCNTKHFQNLKDCDGTQRFGTFPLRKRCSSSKLGLDSVFSARTSEVNTSHLAALDLDTDKAKSGVRSQGTRVTLVKSSSAGDDVAPSGMGGSSLLTTTAAYKVVSIVDDDKHHAYSVTDITTGLHDAAHTRTHDSDSVSENSGGSSGRGQVSSSESSSPVHVRGRGRPRPTAIRVSAMERQASPHRDDKGETTDIGGADVLNDSSTAASLQVLALLNDVLDNYGENESSTDDPLEGKDRDRTPGKKSDFEARMASVAANLDLSKQQRAKRPAPRPPSSPPPEPTVSPKKKSQNQPEPVFKMVPMGKGIMSTPPSHDLPRTSPGQGQGLPSFEDLPEGEGGERSNGDGGRSKKGFTSFFKNILRRGRDSSESFESSNPEVQFAVRSEVAFSSAPSLTEGAAEGMHRKGSDASSSQSKVRVLPPGGASGIKGGSASTGDLPKSAAVRKSESDGTGESMASAVGQPRASSPPGQPRSKGLSSPKQMLKRTAAKLSPPTQHKALPHSKDDAPTTPAKSKPALISRKSDDKESGEAGTTTTTTQPTPVRRRAKSPKRIPPPAPPTRPAGGLGGKSEESLPGLGSTSDLTRELEQKLKSAGISGISGISGSTPALTSTTTTTGTKPSGPAPPAGKAPSSQVPKPDSQPPSATTARSDLRKSMTVPPPSPPTSKPQVSRSPPASPTPEESDSQPGSPTDEMSNSDESPRFMEKIELPTAAPGKKGILGKLNMNRKSRAPAPPSSVKRARSISDAEKRAKRINPADISGPVLVTDASNTTALENRRNTISLGDDPAFNTAAAQSIEKGFDDLDMPILSPLGSLENLYEAILPKEGAPFYDPPDATTRTLCPNVPAEGYLEPVAPSSIATATPEPSLDQSEVADVGATSPARTVGDGGGWKGEEVGGGGSKVLGRSGSGQGETFVEPELTEERRLLIASQPIYEEIPPYAPSTKDDLDTKSVTSQLTQMTDVSHGSVGHGTEAPSHKPPAAVNSATLPHPKRKPAADTGQRSRRSGSMSSHDAPPTPTVKSLVTSAGQPMTSSMTSALPVTSSSSAMIASPFMTASMTSSLMWHTSSPAQPVDSNGELLPLPPIPHMAPRSVSKETVSSESDSQSSAGGTLSRPRPIPRRRPKRPDTAGSDQYVSMNRPNAQVTLGEGKLRETYSRLTSLNFQTLHDMYIQCERLLALEKISLPGAPQHLKWADFDIYGQALHASGRCVVYNAKLRVNNTACQLMVLHSRPAADMSQSAHPSLLRPAAIFADNVPFSFLTADFIKTSQLLQNSVYDSCQARCFLAVGVFDIAESLSSHLALLRETLTPDPGSYLRALLMTALQLLSALSHCLDRGFTVTETDLGDVFHITRPDLRGKVVAFLPHQRAPDVPQGEAMCGFLDRLLQEATNDYYRHDVARDTPPDDEDEATLLTTVERLRLLLEPRRLECLTHVRAVVEYTLWGPGKGGDNSAAGSTATAAGGDNSEPMGEGDSSSVEQDHSVWLERERACMVARFACSLEGLAGGVTLEDFYRLKFLLKSSATSLAECWRRLT